MSFPVWPPSFPTIHNLNSAPSEGVLLFRIFAAPSEGGISANVFYRLYIAVFLCRVVCPPSEGVLFSRIFASPSEGGISANVFYRLYIAVFLCRVVCPPSKGVLFSRIFASPSEGGIYSFLRSRRISRKCDSFGTGRTGYCAFFVFWMVFVAITPLEGVGQMH